MTTNTFQHVERTTSRHQAVANQGAASHAIALSAVPSLQKKSMEDEELQLKSSTQLATPEEEELQMKSAVPLENRAADEVSQRKDNASLPGTNHTGMPDHLKTGIENLSGFSMDDVKVHYNSDKPAQLNALAFAQGTNIHVAPGQGRHLPHEAWHVVQQKQGRVRATTQMKGTVNINDDAGLEKEADVMGEKALQMFQLNQFITSKTTQRMRTDVPSLDSINYSGATEVTQRLEKEEYSQVRDLALKIMEQYPPDQFYYLGLGKSPTPVMAFFQQYGDHAPISATNMPLSKFGHRTATLSDSERRVVDGAPLNSEQRARLWEHFDAFVPGADTLANKSILLIDLVQTGKSLVATQRHLEEYLEEKYQGGPLYRMLCSCFSSAITPEVHALPLAISEQQVGGTKNIMDSLGLTEKAMMIPGDLGIKNSLAAKMGGEKYKPMAEYPEDFKISAPDRPKTSDINKDPKKKYEELRDEFAKFISEDEKLLKFLGEGTVVDSLDDKVEDIRQQLL